MSGDDPYAWERKEAYLAGIHGEIKPRPKEVETHEEEGREDEGRQKEVAARAVLDAAVAEHQPSHLFALFSGGHDSLVSTSLAARHPTFSGVVHINTGIGIEETREFVRVTCRSQGWPLHEVCAPDGLYEQMVLERGGFPGGVQSHNSMLFYLKQQPLARWFKTVPGRRVGFVTGIRKDESVRRMGAGISVPVRRHGLPRNRVVDLLHRSGECLCGALAREREIHEIAAWFPDTAHRINELERECERRGILASVWAGRGAERLTPGQQQLFAKAGYAPLCTSCEASA